MPDTVLEDLKKQVEALTVELAEVRHVARLAKDRGEVENLFNRYMFLHNAFQDEQIIPLWAERGTPGMRARYTNAGQYTDYDSIIGYHQGRPTPTGKLILHATTTPVVEVGSDETAKGVWIMAGTESGLTDPEVAKDSPDYMYSPGLVDGKKVWAHWVWCKYAVDFIKQHGEWKIWKFRCYELARAPFEENWVSFGEKNQHAFDLDLMYFGDDGKAVFMPPADEPAPEHNHPYSPLTKQKLEPAPPAPYDVFEDTFR